jgi:chromosome segregation ATPase
LYFDVYCHNKLKRSYEIEPSRQILKDISVLGLTLRSALQEKNKQQELLRNLNKALGEKRITPQEYDSRIKEYQAALTGVVEKIASTKKEINSKLSLENQRINGLQAQLKDNYSNLNAGRIDQNQYQINSKALQDNLAASKILYDELESLANAKAPADIHLQVVADNKDKPAGSRKILVGSLLGALALCWDRVQPTPRKYPQRFP